MTTMLDVALARASEGLRVFPLIARGRSPLIRGWQAAATTDPARVRAWWWDPVMETPLDHNIGVATGQGLVVVDIDMKNGKDGEKSLRVLQLLNEDFPPTRVVLTPSGGRHFYFRANRPVPCSYSKVGSGIDVKGEGGYVVGPGSVVEGGVYAG